MTWSSRVRRRSHARDQAIGDGKPFRSDRDLIQTAIFAVFIIALLLVYSIGTPGVTETEGRPATRDYTVRETFDCQDYVKTDYLRDQARITHAYEAARDPQDYDDLIQTLRSEGIAPVRQAQPQGRYAVPAELVRDPERLRPLLDEIERAGTLSEAHYLAEVQRKSQWLLVRDRERDEETQTPLDRLVVLSPEHESLRALIARRFPSFNSDDQRGLAVLLAGRLHPTLRQDPNLAEEINARRTAAVPTSRKTVLAGETIVRKGTRIQRQHLEEIQAEQQAFAQSSQGGGVRAQGIIGVCATLLVVVGVAGLYVILFEPRILAEDAQYLALLGWTMVLAVTTRLFYLQNAPETAVIVPLWAMVLAVALNRRFAAEMAVFGALLAGLAGYRFTPVVFVLAVGGVVAALTAGRARYRSDLIKAGVFAALVEVACVWGAGLIEMDTGLTWDLRQNDLVNQSLLLGLTALASGFVASGCVPWIERAFGVSTDIGLLEWSDPSKPLLQRMLREAPGTHHHSMIVGSLAADAAESIGANPLLARVSAYYHDVGKLNKPDYFIENLTDEESNPHDHLSPTMSSLIITAHTRDGADLAAQHRLPRSIRDVILQHHGTTRVEFFFRRAQERSEDETVTSETFQYRGPKPQSREAAAVMLCDTVESATRALRDAPTKLAACVHELIMTRLLDGQLDESGLSMTDLHRIEQVLARGLAAIYHRRIAYPDDAGKEEHESAPQARH